MNPTTVSNSTLTNSLQGAVRSKGQDIVYYTPVYQDVHLGGVPYDYVDTNPNPVNPVVSCDNNVCGAYPNEVHRNLPVLNPNGTPKLEAHHLSFHEKPFSPLTSFSLWGAVGATLGATIGLLVGGPLGSTLWGGVGGGLALGVASGALGVVKLRNVRDELQWQTGTITNLEYTGYRETVTPSGDPNAGNYQHHFEPMFKSIPLGTYKVPRIVPAGTPAPQQPPPPQHPSHGTSGHSV